jgi:hypothetical protein
VKHEISAFSRGVLAWMMEREVHLLSLLTLFLLRKLEIPVKCDARWMNTEHLNTPAIFGGKGGGADVMCGEWILDGFLEEIKELEASSSSLLAVPEFMGLFMEFLRCKQEN